jgi:4-amino-4-deoxy-L-arabinose transferase-like glycosyltransferase
MSYRIGSNVRRERLLIFGAALLVAFFVTFVIWRAQSFVDNTRSDPYGFLEMARMLVDGRGFEGMGVLLHRRGPFYPMFIAGIFSVVGESLLVVRLVQCLLFAGTCLLVHDLGRRIYNDRTGVIAALACMVHPSLLRYVPDFHLECLFTFLVTLMVWQSVRLVERPTLGAAALFGGIAGIASLTKSVTLFYPLAFGAIWLFTRRATLLGPTRNLLPLVAAGVSVVSMALVIAPWTAKNYQLNGGHIVPVSTGLSDAFLRGYVFSRTEFLTLQQPPYTDAENESNELFRSLCRAEGTVWQANDVETEAILARAAKKKLFEDPLLFVRKAFVGIFAFWYEMTSLKTSLIAGLTALAGWVLAFFGFRRSRSESRPVWLLLAPILYLNALQALLLALGRYSVPIVPCLMTLAAFGVDTILARQALTRRPQSST